MPYSEDLQKYTIIIIDGLYREACLKKSVDYLDGILILDDSERNENGDLKSFKKRKFKALNFWGLAAGIFI